MNMHRLHIIVVLLTLTVLLILPSAAQFRSSAREMLASADSLAKIYGNNIQICEASASNLDTMGKSNTWVYSYLAMDTVNPINSQMLYIIADSAHVRFDHYGIYGPGVTTMTDYWMNSDSAFLVAQHLGGSAIMKVYPSCLITAWVGQLPAPPFVSYWQINYDCKDTIRMVRFNAITGEYLNSSNFPTFVQEAMHTDVPARFELRQSFPNPFNPTCTISFALSNDGFVSLSIVDIFGREVSRLISEPMHAGNHSRQWNARGAASGTYFSRLESGGYVQTKKLILIK